MPTEAAKYKVVVYLKTSLDKFVVVEQTSLRHARKYARNIQRDGVRVQEPDAEVYYPVHEVFKVKVMPETEGCASSLIKG